MARQNMVRTWRPELKTLAGTHRAFVVDGQHPMHAGPAPSLTESRPTLRLVPLDTWREGLALALFESGNYDDSAAEEPLDPTEWGCAPVVSGTADTQVAAVRS